MSNTTTILKMSCSRIVFATEVQISEKHRLLSDTDFLRMMAKNSLYPAFFTHEAHIRLAWLTINTFGFEEARNIICDMIKQFDRYHGDGTRFNRALILKAAKIIWDCMLKLKSKTFPDFMDEYPELYTHFRQVVP